MSSSPHPPPATVIGPPDTYLVDDFAVNEDHYANTLLDADFLSPYNYPPGVNSSTSPSYAVSSPGDSYSEYTNYESSVVDDEFLGVNFDILNRVDSLPTTHPNRVNLQNVETSRGLPDAPSSASELLPASIYPLSPVHSSLQNTPSPAAAWNASSARTTVSPHELTKGAFPPYQYNPATLAPAHLTAVQLTPNHSGSSRASAERFEPGTMTQSEQDQHPRAQPNTAKSQLQSFAQFGAHYVGPPATAQADLQWSEPAIQRNDDGGWTTSERTGQSGLGPEHRVGLTGAEILSLKQQQEQRHIAQQNLLVQQWKSAASSDTEDDRREQSYFSANHTDRSEQENQRTREDIAPEDDDDGGLAPADDAASIHENRLVEGQTYWNFRGVVPTEVDLQIINQPRHWSDAPSLPYITSTKFQPQTANEAMRKWNVSADTYSITSRAATWGTRRRSEPSLLDYEAVADGSFFTKLSISRPGHGRRRQSSIFSQGLDQLASIVRKRSDSKLKRTRSSQNVSADYEEESHPRLNSQGSLAVPGRSSSFGKNKMPSINTAMAAMTDNLAAVGTSHARSGSIGGATTSPKSPRNLGFISVIRRARSKSDFSTHDAASQNGLAGLWRGHGGPPVARLASPVETETMPMARQLHIPTEPQEDDDDEDEDEDDLADERDVKLEQGQGDEPIIPTYEGFKDHVRRLNPNIDSQYNWLVSRIAHQQDIRYKSLLELRVKHQVAVQAHNCASASLCNSVAEYTLLNSTKSNRRDSGRSVGSLQVKTDFSDDSNSAEGALSGEAFPPGVPLPPIRSLPAEFECHLCFKAKRFQKPSDWTKHVHEDVQPFTCTWDKCKDTKSFKRKADWVRHENERHRHLEWWICDYEDCKHQCFRKDNFLQHLVREHKFPEPKQKTKAAIKKARSTERVWVMLDQCHHETPNKPQDEPCKFCGQTFTTWKKLTVHLSKHMQNISLPVLRLVEERVVNANTIISPVEQNLTPITPNTHTKIESNSPFDMESISPHVNAFSRFPTSGFGQSSYFQTAGPSPSYGMHALPSQPQPGAFDPSSSYQMPYGTRQSTSPQSYGGVTPAGINHASQSRAFGSLDSGFPPYQRNQARPYSSIDSTIPHALPNQGYVTHQATEYSMPQNLATEPPPVSGFQTSSLLGVADPSYGFDHLNVNAAQSFQQVPTSNPMRSASPYEHSPQHTAYYG